MISENNKKQKILHISRTMGQGGAEKIVEQLCVDINTQNHVVASTGGYRVKNLRKHNITHYEIPDIANKNPFIMSKTIRTLNSIIKKEHIDIIHSHHRMAAFYARILKLRNANLKLIYTAHNVYTDKKILSQFSLKNTKIIACGKNVEKNLNNFYKIPKEKIATIINSVKPPELQSIHILPKKQNNQIYLASVGRLTNDKGIDIFINALSIIKQKNNLNFHAFIIGDGEERKNLENQVKKLNLQSCITFLGFQKEALSIIKPVDIIVSPSRREGLPLTILEMLSLGKPIVVSDIDSHKEIIKNNFNGFIFKSENSIDLTNKILRLTSNQELLSALAKNAQKSQQASSSYKTFISKYNNVYNG